MSMSTTHKLAVPFFVVATFDSPELRKDIQSIYTIYIAHGLLDS